jgi:hypothetical protein
MKYSEIEYYGTGLAMLMQANLKLPGIQKLELIKLRKQLEEASASVNEARLQLCNEYSEEDENGQPKMVDHNYVIKKDLIVEFNVQLRQLYNNEIALDIKKTKVSIPDNTDLESQAVETLLLIADSEDIFQK